MPIEITLVVSPKQAADKNIYIPIAARKAGVNPEQVALARITRRSIDARAINIKVNLTVQLFVDTEQSPAPIHFDYGDVSTRTPVVIVGAGPAGLFAALRLIELGVKPIIVERGKKVSDRKLDIAQINRNAEVNPDSNYAFGEGGAGTFSDGKLYTRSKKRGDFRKALETFVFHGAHEEILYDAHPHIGTDRLPQIIEAMRKTIISSGGEIHFNTRVAQFIIKDSRAQGVIDTEGNRIEGAAVILATGHSARDIYHTLHADGVRLEPKPYAMGVRIEHPQSLIDTIQYHTPNRGEYLPAASYTLANQIAGRGVYSFCMCPGGFIVPALTSPGEAVVNGMSPSGRNSIFANSGIVTEIREADYAHLVPKHGVLAGLKFQEDFEALAFKHGGGKQIVPAQRVADFVGQLKSGSLPRTSYHPGVASSEINRWLPRFISTSLRYGIENFGKKMRGFVTNDALILGVESRTSSPVRIPRDANTLMHPEVSALFPCGEGAGYAGGIISAAIDGEQCAEQCVRFLY